MKFLSIRAMIFCFFMTAVMASTSFAQNTILIHSIEKPENQLDTYKILSALDGLVYRVNSDQTAILETLNSAFANKHMVSIETSTPDAYLIVAAVETDEIMEDPMTTDDELNSAEESESLEPNDNEIGTEILKSEAYKPKSTHNEEYSATHLTSLEQIEALFKTLEKDFPSRNRLMFKGVSQCTARATVWSYRMWRKHGVYGMKAFLFFSSKFRRERDYDWWFHVTPFVYYKNAEGVVQELSMDRMFMKKPTELHPWSNYFVKRNEKCLILDKYQDSMRTSYQGSCLIRKVPMYYQFPLNANNLDFKGIVLTNWDMGYVNMSVRYIGNASRNAYKEEMGLKK